VLRTRILLVTLAVAAVGYLALPAGSVAQGAYHLGVSVVALVTAIVGIRRHRPRRTRIWMLFLTGMALRIAGDAMWFLYETVLDMPPFPSPADLLYVASYLPMVAGLAFLVSGRQPGRDRAALLDAFTIATGIGVIVAVFVIQPAIPRLDQGLLAPVTGAAYPLADVLLIAILARLWATPCRGLAAYGLLHAALGLLLVGDIGYAAAFLSGEGTLFATPLFDVVLLLAYVAVAAATSHPSVRTLSDPAPDTDERFSRARLAVMAAASMLAPASMMVDGMLGHALYWQVIGPASILLFALVLARVAGLLQQVQRQAVQLAALARNDSLTGAPNRRTWDHELSRACAAARESGEPLTVALLDLDRFKDFNDSRGHAAGDLLLKEATAAWVSVLPTGTFLARYGGEEFTVLLPGHTCDEAYTVMERLRAVTPMGKTFSAGLAVWDHTEQPAALVARADARLYEAKRAGRDRTLPVPSNIDLTRAPTGERTGDTSR
jgi:diguanylate cyclase (GGDEF)-like protein